MTSETFVMCPDDGEASDRRDVPPPSDDGPEAEGAYTPHEPADGYVFEDEPELLDPTIRSLEREPAEPDGLYDSSTPAPTRPPDEVEEREDAGDTDAIVDEAESEAEPVGTGPVDWDHEYSARRVVVELKRVETEIRELLEGRDSKRKRKLTGTRRWLELEEDILSWRFAGRFSEETIARLRRLISRRHYLFRRLRFLAGTRSTWNT